MSLVGPRPESRNGEALEKYSTLSNAPLDASGLSGWAQVCAPYTSSIDDSHLKLSYDLYYLKRFNLWLDIIIMIRTVKTILSQWSLIAEIEKEPIFCVINILTVC